MNNPVAVPIISAAASLVAVAASYWFTKAREREADWRKQKLDHYRELLEAISGIVAGESTPGDQRRYARATNAIGLVASQEVIQAVDRLREVSRPSAGWTKEQHDAALAALLLAIRRDLGIRPKDNPATFTYSLWASGAGPASTTQ